MVSTNISGVKRDLEEMWSLYFPADDDAYDVEDPKVRIILRFREFFLGVGAHLIENIVWSVDRHLIIRYSDLVNGPLEDLDPALFQHPLYTIACVSAAVALCAPDSQTIAFKKKVRFIVRIHGYPRITALKDIKSNLVDKFIAVKGNVVRVGLIKPLVLGMQFSCSTCDDMIEKKFIDGKFEAPTRCNTGSCKSRTFNPERDTAITVDSQTIKIQEADDEHRSEPGRTPRTIEVELTDELVDTVVPGDIISISGIVKAINAELSGGRATNAKKALFLLYLTANSLVCKGRGNGSLTSNQEEIEALDTVQFSAKEMRGINTIASSAEVFKLLVNSLCPVILGQEVVKAGLLLSLFGGTRNDEKSSNTLAIRGDPHVLVVGDPGLGKSQMLKAVCSVAPRGVYVTGGTTTTTGLTVTMVRDKMTGDQALEAGALVLADRGVCCIDEFDKMGAEQNALLEAMEQQSVSIAKAGISVTLLARATVIAAANPIRGHFDKSRIVGENLKMNPALLSRFDLVYVLLDKPDEDRDRMLTKHVLNMHGLETINEDEQDLNQSIHHTQNRARVYQESRKSEILKKITLKPGERLDPIPHQLLRKYIAYAKKYVHPLLSADACVALREFYIGLREKHSNAHATPLTTRQLEALVRLSQARAKMELRDVVTKMDAQDVIEIFKETLFETALDEFGCFDFSRTSGMGKAKQVKLLVSALNKAAQRKGSTLFTVTEIKEIMGEMNEVNGVDAMHMIEILNQQNYILKKGASLYGLMSSSINLSQMSSRSYDSKAVGSQRR